MQTVMMAFFSDTDKRDQAVAAAKEAGINIRGSGLMTLALPNGQVSEEAHPFCLFRGEAMSAITFMQNGAMSCGPA